ncbi:MAG: DUF11 domain-containing protein, partial [Actinomycetia bacterium]|nr:DUF11 domain-containing protein [Actinomycetes bacterium]
VISDAIPAHTAFVSAASHPAWSCNATTCILALGALAAGEPSQSFDIALTVDDPLAAGVTEVFNSAVANDDGSSGPDLNAADNTATDSTPIDSGPGGTGPDLSLIKTDGGATVSAGGLVTYTLTIVNIGNQDTTGVVLTDAIPTHTGFNSEASHPSWSCDATSCTLAVGALGAGDSPQSFDIAFTVDEPLPAGVTEITNTAFANDNGTSG